MKRWASLLGPLGLVALGFGLISVFLWLAGAPTDFAWIGGTGPDDVFYYRVQSPVILIEFDHLPGIVFDNDYATRRHIHTIVRTPNGNDYGKNLLAQHYAQHHR